MTNGLICSCIIYSILTCLTHWWIYGGGTQGPCPLPPPIRVHFHPLTLFSKNRSNSCLTTSPHPPPPPRGFIKGRGQGKLTVCESEFARLFLILGFQQNCTCYKHVHPYAWLLSPDTLLLQILMNPLPPPPNPFECPSNFAIEIQVKMKCLLFFFLFITNKNKFLLSK